MTISTEFQPYINPAMNQPRTCIWIKPESIEDFQNLQLVKDAIVNNSKVIAGFTGIDKQTLLIQLPLS